MSEQGLEEWRPQALLSPVGRAFAAALAAQESDHPRFRGPPLIAAQLTAEDLGVLMTLRDQRGVENLPQTASHAAILIHDALNHRRPRFDAATGLACLRARIAATEAALSAAREAVGGAENAPDAAALERARAALRRVGHEAADLQWRFVLVAAASETPIVKLADCAEEIQPLLRAMVGMTAVRLPEEEDGAQPLAFAPDPRALLVMAAARAARDGVTAAQPEIDWSLEPLAGSPLALQEAETLLAAPLRQHAEMALRHKDYPNVPTLEERECAAIDGYAAFARNALETAEERLAALRAGRSTYHSDKAFTYEDCLVVELAMRVGLAIAAPWAESRIGALLDGVAIAPGAAKTAPSQALTHRLGRAAADFPSPASVLALRAVREAVRHAGLKKKLDRFSKDAERALAERPDLLLILPEEPELPKPLLLAAKRSFETLYRIGPRFALADWRARFWERKELKTICAGLIWRLESAEGAVSAMPMAKRGALVWRDAAGEILSPPEETQIALWHPLSALKEEGAEALEAWREALIASGVKQPFLQAFRQHYPLTAEEAETSESDRFAGHHVAVKALIGVGQAAGWRFDGGIDYHLVWRTADGDELALSFACGAHHPGADWNDKTGILRLFRRGGEAGWHWRAAAFSEADPVALSEAFRSVDLITAVGARAYDPEAHAAALAASLTALRARSGYWSMLAEARAELPGAQSAGMRREALARLYGEDPAVSVEARQVVLGPYRLNIATGRITRDGDPVDQPPPPPAKAAWIPFEDPILGDIVKAVAALKPTIL